MHICFFVEGYPYKGDPFMTFVQELIREVAKQNVKCTVICPQSLTRALGHKLPVRPMKWIDQVDKGTYIDVMQPYYFTLPSFSKITCEKIATFTAKRAYHKITEKPDVLYGHFWGMGMRAYMTDNTLPTFVACGESVIQDYFRPTDKQNLVSHLKGVIYVSKDCYREALEKDFQKNQRYIIAPNGFNPNEFHPLNRYKSRAILGWPQEAIVVSFLGAFNDRKGVNRLSSALSKINESEKVYSCFLGNGTMAPDCPNILFQGKVDHENVATYLAASDMFVLPTLHEGCSNAIVEALACGLPVISSNLSFNDELLDETNSIRINPNSVEEIECAIKDLAHDPLKRDSLSKGAINKAENLMINVRAKKIIDFIETCI